jgi:cytochrome c-type biogenesis protein CcmH/NrfF
VREGPEFVLWVATWGSVVVLVVVGISVLLFWLLKRWSDRQTAALDREHKEREKAGAERRP